MTAIRQLNPRAALLAAAIAVILMAVAAFAVQSSPLPALAQSNSAAPANVAARNGVKVGEVIVSWTPNATAVSNRVGWANYAEVEVARDAGNWLEAFNFVDIGGAKNSYTVKRLDPGAQHAFIVATVAANGTYTWPIGCSSPPPRSRLQLPVPLPAPADSTPRSPAFAPLPDCRRVRGTRKLVIVLPALSEPSRCPL